MHLITSLLLLLTVSRLLGRLFKSLGYYPIIGEILAGVLLGPSVFGLVESTENLKGIVELAVFLLIFASGLEVDLKDFIVSLKERALLCSLITFVGSFAAGLGVGTLLQLSLFTSVIISLCFAITSIPVALNVLSSTKLMGTKVGHTVMGTAVVLEILSLLVLGITFDAQESSSFMALVKVIFLKGTFMLVFFFSIMVVNKILRAELRHINRTQKLVKQLIGYVGEEAVFGMGLVFVLVFSTLAEALGFHFIIGAFFGGLLLNKDIIGTDIFRSLSHTLESITSHFFTPIFFAHLGLLISVEAFDNWVPVLVIIGVGYGAKIFSSWLGARISGFDRAEALKIGLVLNSRGTFDLIVANLALSKGHIDSQFFSILILFGVLSVLFNPIIYRQSFYREKTEVSQG